MKKIYTAKEKAEQLIEMFSMDNTTEGYRRAIRGAIYCVKEIKENVPLIKEINNYWNEVINEIKKNDL
jgi:hypothetical protein